jgi:hypothetical protein
VIFFAAAALTLLDPLDRYDQDLVYFLVFQFPSSVSAPQQSRQLLYKP